jgi:hypothetical protein
MMDRTAWLVDAHVHLHDPFLLTDAFAAADRHFRQQAGDLSLADGWAGCLMLAENEGEARFRQLQSRGLGSGTGEWSVRPTAEDVSLLVCHAEQPRFVLVAGRQVVTADRLEVLTLGTAEPVANGSATEHAIDHAAAEHALAIIPWGFGKWWAGRGARIARLVGDSRGRTFFLGDNGGRPHSFPAPPLLRTAAHHGIWNLPGSDPLPLPGEASRTGSYGFLVPARPDLNRPFAQIREGVGRFRAQPRLFGKRAGVRHFLNVQTRLRLHARSGRASP